MLAFVSFILRHLIVVGAQMVYRSPNDEAVGTMHVNKPLVPEEEVHLRWDATES